jgi:mRNA interferase YafQ
MYTFFPTNRFNKAFQKARKHKKYKESEFIFVIDTLLSGKKLPKKYREHKLSGEYEGCLECHIQNDVLLIYYFDNGKCILVGVDIGTHSELFG